MEEPFIEELEELTKDNLEHVPATAKDVLKEKDNKDLEFVGFKGAQSFLIQLLHR